MHRLPLRLPRFASPALLAATTLLMAVPADLRGGNLVWDFEGRVNVEGDAFQDRLYDQTGVLKFHLVTPAGGDTFDRFSEGVPSNPVRYDAINDQSPITSTPGVNPVNEWLVRADWSYSGSSHTKHGDGDTGEFISDPFIIDGTSSFTMDVGGGSSPNGLFLHRAEDDSVIISEHRGGSFLQARDWTNSELTAAGITGTTEVYLRIADATTGGWGHVTVDNIVANNASLPEIPEINSFSASSQNITAGTPVTLSWTITDPLGAGTQLAITPSPGDVSGLSSTIVSPTETTTYTLSAENANGSTSAQLTITVDEPPAINFFTAAPDEILLGASSTLNWSVDGADSVTIDQAVGVVTGSSSTPVSPTDTTTYTLTASNAAGDSTAQVTITVDRSPLISSFTATPANTDPGAQVDLAWTVANADTLSIDQGIGVVTGQSNATDNPTSTLTYTLTATNADGVSTATATVIVGETLTISEFLAINDSGMADEDGDFSDWVEIHNTTGATINLGGWYLTDDPANLTKWQFPAVDLGAGAYTYVFASGKNRAIAGGELHSNFKLDGDGEYLALVKPDGTSITRHFSPEFPAQEADISYGLFGAALTEGFFDPPTPGAANGTGFDGFVGDTSFSHDRGFYSSPIDVAITSDTPGAEIRYTLNGDEPSDTSGTLYTAPVPISSTTVLRAIAYKPGFRPSNIDTQTYLFTADIKTQPEMDGDVLGVAPYSASIEDDLKSIPTMSLVLPDSSMFGATGIYSNSGQRGIAWERALSVEFFTADGGEEFQVDAGIRIHGADARNHQKKPFKLYFRGDYGPGKLRYPLFPGRVEEFDKLVLRGGGHEGWTSPYGSGTGAQAHSATFLRDQFLRQTHGEMGNLSPRGRHCHLYINGAYWGLYVVHERADEEFGEAHLGGAEDDYDVIKTQGAVVDGTKTDWNSVMALANSGLSGDAEYAQMLDAVDMHSLVDNMIVRIWSGDIDWLRSQNTIGETGGRNKNWYALRKTRGAETGKWQFFVWDGELSMGKGHRSNRNTTFDLTDVDINDSPGRLYTRLRENAEFRLLFGDRLQKHFFNGGAMTPANNQTRWNTLAAEIEDAVVAESARWGDATRGTPYTRNGEWQSEVDWMANTFMASRNATVLSQFQAINLYPGLDAPDFTVDGSPQHGGAIGNSAVGFTAPPSGIIYYTTDGSDPRMSTSGASETVLLDEFAPNTRALVPSVANGGSTLTAAQWTGLADPPNLANWLSGTTGVGYENSPSDYAGLIDINVIAMRNNTGSAYVRVPFNVADQAALDSIDTLTLRMKYDDGFVAYINGTPVQAVNDPAVLDWQAESTADHPDSQATSFQAFDISAHKGELQVGDNILAIHALNVSVTSSDLLVMPKLSYTTAAATGVSPSAQAYSAAFSLPASRVVRARVLDGGVWSALNEATFLVGTLAAAGNAVVSELMYNPAGASEDLEFIELANISGSAVDFSNVHFGAGLEFSVPVGTVVPAGGRLLIVNDLAAFEAQYGAGLPIAGQFAAGTNLDNNGERITLLAADGSTIESFTYMDEEPWPESADGDGPSLTRILTPPPANDPDDPRSWRPSLAAGGSPGGSDAVAFAGNAADDDDGDGLDALLEHGFGSSDAAFTSLDDVFTLSRDGAGGMTVTLRRALSADDVRLELLRSDDLETWVPAGFEFLGTLDNGDGTMTLRYSSSTDFGPRHYWRVQATEIAP